MKTLMLLAPFLICQMALAKDKKLPDRKEIYNRIDNEINKRTDIKDKDKQKLKKEIREAELTTLRKSKLIEQELKDSNSNNPVVKDFFEFKKTITQKKKIGNEEFEVLKDAEVLRDEFLKKKKDVLDSYRKNKPKNSGEVTVQNDLKEVQYPIPVPRKTLLTTPATPYKVTLTHQETKKTKLWPWILGLTVSALLGIYLLKRKRS